MMRYRFWLIVLLAVTLIPELGALAFYNYANIALLYEFIDLPYLSSIPVCPEKRLFDEKQTDIKNYLERSIANYPRARINLGRLNWIKGECDLAFDLWVDSLSENPNELPAVVGLVWDGRFEYIPVRYHEKIGGYAIIQGEIASKAGAIERVFLWYNLALQYKPGRETANNLVNLYQKSNDSDKILETWRKVAVALPETHPEHWWALGQIAEIEKSWEEAASFYSSGAQLTPKPYDYLINAGQAYEQLSDWEKAELAYLQAKDARPDQYIPYLYIGHLAFNQKDFSKAIEYYQVAQDVDPTNVLPLYHLGATYYQLGEDDEAEMYLQESLRIRPQYPWSAYTLSLLYYRKGDIQEATSYLTKAIEWNPSSSWSWVVLLGDWWAELGDCEQAKAAYKNAELMGTASEALQKKLADLAHRCP